MLSTLESGLVVSSSLGGALLGSGVALVVGQQLGRRRELLASAWLYGGGSLLVGFARGYGMLLLGRTVYGGGIGLAMHAAPAYIAETSPPRVRGFLISLKEAFVVIGILLGYTVSYIFISSRGGWRWMYGIGVMPAVALGTGMVRCMRREGG